MYTNGVALRFILKFFSSFHRTNKRNFNIMLVGSSEGGKLKEKYEITTQNEFIFGTYVINFFHMKNCG